MSPEDLRLRARVKEEIRKRMRAIRQAHPVEARERRSAEAAKRLEQLDEWQRAQRIAGYVAIHGEIDPRLALDAAREAGKTIVLPRVDLEAQRVILHVWEGEALDQGAFGIPEPSPDAPQVEEVDLVLVPALGVDPAGHRIGWGKGFYDRLLSAEAASAFRVALVYDFQLLAECPVTPLDVPVHAVVTDARSIRVGEGSEG